MSMPEPYSPKPIDMLDSDTSPELELAAALGQVVAHEREHYGRVRELVEAQIEARLAHLRAESVEALARLDAKIIERLATLRDGERGADGKQGETGPQGPQGEAGPRGADGPQGALGQSGAAGDQGERGPQGAPGIAGGQGERGEIGPRGEKGDTGKLPLIKAWVPDTVFYAGDVVAHAGSSFQAMRDTGQEPPHRDWIALAIAGITPRVRGLWSEGESYRSLDIVVLNGGSFVARHDDPGVCPGGGWQSLVQPGRPGKAGDAGPIGERGPPGPKGLKGDPGPRLLGAHIDRANYRAVLRMSDGTEATLELRELFEQFHRESQ